MRIFGYSSNWIHLLRLTLGICYFKLGAQMDFVTEAMLCKVFRWCDSKPPDLSSPWWTIPFQSHQILSITFLGINTGFATVCEAFPGFDHDLFCTLLSYVIHFSSPVIIRFKNGSISFRFSSDTQMELGPFNVSLLNHMEPKYRASFGIQSYVLRV